MLTSRGFWFFLSTFAVLTAALFYGAHQLTLICLTLLLWFLGQWLIFHLRLRITLRRLSLTRTLRTSRGDVSSIWTRQKAEVAVVVSNSSWLWLPYVVVSERLPALARVKEGPLTIDGALAKDAPLSFSYSLECPAPGWLRFEGVKIELADLQGFFTYATFIADPKAFRVLPALVVESTDAPFVKQHNVLPLLGTHRHARPGGSSELLDLRDYLPGDPPRMIAWKVSARRDRLITKEFESEVPIRCTLFLDTSSSVRVGPVGQTALCRLVEIAAGVLQRNASERDLTGLCLFDENSVHHAIKAGRGSQHMLRALGLLTDIAGLVPKSRQAQVRDLVPVAFGLVQDVYPGWLEADVNHFPFWLPLWSPQPKWVLPPGVAYSSRWSPTTHRLYRWRKQLAAILAVRYGLAPGGLAMLLEDDDQCAYYLQRFLAEYQVSFPFTLYDNEGRYQFAAPEKARVIARAILKAVTHGKDNELFVLCIDLLESAQFLGELERAICVAKARHHQVIVICPWPAGVEAPGTKLDASGPFEIGKALRHVAAVQLHKAYAEIQHAFSRYGVPVFCTTERDSVDRVLQRMRRLRIQERGVR
jgi:uncharacterized protein (DUF58 family)